jgi:hypothetical protein
MNKLAIVIILLLIFMWFTFVPKEQLYGSRNRKHAELTAPKRDTDEPIMTAGGMKYMHTIKDSRFFK